MSNTQSAYGSDGGREFAPNEWANAPWRRGACGASRWSAFEIAAMVLGFIVFWPIGLALIGYKFWQRHYNADPSIDMLAVVVEVGVSVSVSTPVVPTTSMRSPGAPGEPSPSKPMGVLTIP